MKITIQNVAITFDVPELDAIISKLAAIEQINQSLNALLTQGLKMTAELDALTIQVQQNTDLESSAISLIQGLAAQLKAIANDPAAINALADQLHASAGTLSEAITANTPAAP